jgi:hypothetical protein
MRRLRGCGLKDDVKVGSGEKDEVDSGEDDIRWTWLCLDGNDGDRDLETQRLPTLRRFVIVDMDSGDRNEKGKVRNEEQIDERAFQAFSGPHSS